MERIEPVLFKAKTRLMLGLGLLLLTFSIALVARVRFVRPPANLPVGLGKIDLNTATLQELSLMPGIGEKTAKRILADRQSRGPFHSVDDLTRIAGIGPRTVAELADFCKVESSPAFASRSRNANISRNATPVQPTR